MRDRPRFSLGWAALTGKRGLSLFLRRGRIAPSQGVLMQEADMVPVTILTGFLGSGKTTLLNRILGDLKDKRDQGALKFDRVVIETTGMADPGPVAQTFFTDDEIGNYYLLDSIITIVDAKHAPKQLDEFHEAQEQVGFADRLLRSKTDLVSEDQVAELSKRLKHMNPRAPIKKVHFGDAPLAEVLDIRGFNLNAIL